MFTIKHIDDYGNEDLFQASSVKVLRGERAEGDFSEEGVKIEGVVDRDFAAVHYPFHSPNDPRATTGFEAAIYVMNEAGATVAKYLL